MPDRTNQTAEVVRILHRYLTEVVEPLQLCPWAQPARLGDELRIELVWAGADRDDQLHAVMATLSAQNDLRIALVLAPDSEDDPMAWRRIRERMTTVAPRLAMAEFHPHAPFADDNEARVVPLLRRSPDRLLQVVPHEVLANVSRPSSRYSNAEQARALLAELATSGTVTAPVPPADVRARIARDNFATVKRVGVDELLARYAAIAEDRHASYARVGIIK